VDHICSAGIRACLSTILNSALLEKLPRSQGTRTRSEDVPSDSFIRRELNAHLCAEARRFYAVRRRALYFLISLSITIQVIETRK
ncbi:hypothetical protein ALC62_05913, partial [Cyphomyrmex costatus]